MKVGRILGKVSDVDQIDTELLLAHVLHVSRGILKAYPERELTDEESGRFATLLERRRNGEPVAYLLGHKEFWSLDFTVTPDVLIPRADTELLVEIALEKIEHLLQPKILDLGTGCGAIALAVAAELPDATVIATDESPEALQVAQQNAKKLHINNVQFALGNWYNAILNEANPRFNLILSNPPYVADHDPHLQQGDLRFEPKPALVGGTEGMDNLHKIISFAPQYLLADGLLMVEHGYDQESLVRQEFIRAGFTDVSCYKDISGIPRVTIGRGC